MYDITSFLIDKLEKLTFLFGGKLLCLLLPVCFP